MDSSNPPEAPGTPKPVSGIHALPPSTVKLLGSSQVLADSSSVVKELIENALDARATGIFVEIAANTIDIIQVRDNGHGIAPEDRDSVCLRYYTNKIRDFDELREIGGTWLGFRGEALASMAEMSGSLSVMTRVDGEPVAALLKIQRNGEIQGTERASHPVGTTVRVTDFLKHLPVRKQEALKHSSKYVAKVKRLLQAYALARPTVRFQFRVLKAKSEKSNWIYAPKSGANVEDAAFKVVGRDCASQCDWTATESYGFDIRAFLPRPDADPAKIANQGTFLAIDSRPVSVARGALQQISTLFKTKLRKASDRLSSVRDPFMSMNIICPPGSYDPNIEPAKDDVLFENSDAVLVAVDKLLTTLYPENLNNGSFSSPLQDRGDRWFGLTPLNPSQPAPQRSRRRPPAAGVPLFPTEESPGQANRGRVLNAAKNLVEGLSSSRNRDIRDFVSANRLRQTYERDQEQDAPSNIIEQLQTAARGAGQTNSSPGPTWAFIPVNPPQHVREQLRAGCRDFGRQIGPTDEGTRNKTPHNLNLPSNVKEEQPSRTTKRNRIDNPSQPSNNTSTIHPPGQATAPTNRRNRSQRTKSSKLPLERIPSAYRIQNAILTISTSVDDVFESMQKLDIPGETVPEEMDDVFATAFTPERLRRWCCRLDVLLKERYDRENGVDTFDRLLEMVRMALLGREG